MPPAPAPGCCGDVPAVPAGTSRPLRSLGHPGQLMLVDRPHGSPVTLGGCHVLIRDGGDLHTGSERCPSGRQFAVRASRPGGSGQEFVGAGCDGILEQHGPRRRSGTLLDRTLHPGAPPRPRILREAPGQPRAQPARPGRRHGAAAGPGASTPICGRARAGAQRLPGPAAPAGWCWPPWGTRQSHPGDTAAAATAVREPGQRLHRPPALQVRRGRERSHHGQLRAAGGPSRPRGGAGLGRAAGGGRRYPRGCCGYPGAICTGPPVPEGGELCHAARSLLPKFSAGWRARNVTGLLLPCLLQAVLGAGGDSRSFPQQKISRSITGMEQQA